ncbi:CD3324 family protein [Fredinandcohnia quinoae]|uniref:Mor transcription activator domain-containing protein n=1 Tax=Fredinandcohnia quinoae TaxID=2918902 RepID=A0AAW5E752_9BACI|nr:CD3324 family protein [Fredinandcohnia sp. SECRCQ15]MCH1625732.1 hypothetical protein [Fredinandcohnia sp. SECRCQ15]
MSYINAESVLPEEIIKIIQQYVDGKPLYIPRKNENKKSWGEKSGSREALKKRNREIYKSYLNGATISELTTIYYLSEKSLQRIIRQERVQSS